MKIRRRRLCLENLEFRRLLAAVTVPDDLQAPAGSEIAAPITIDSGAGVRAAEIHLAYDPALLDLQTSDITAGTVWASGSDTQVVVNLNAQDGQIVIFVSAPQAAGDQAGSLVTLQFTVRQGAAVGSEAVIDLIEVRLNEGAIDVTPAPVAGDDSTDGRITVTENDTGQADRIGGTVYADADNDHTVDPGEALPGVTITLIEVATGQQRTAVTDDDGQFQFTDLPAGQYRLVQTQPLAYLDGGNNEIELALAVGENQASHDFRELGLRAAYLGNRLASTIVMPPGSTGWTTALRSIQAAANPPAAETTSDSLPPAAVDQVVNQVFAAATTDPAALLTSPAATRSDNAATPVQHAAPLASGNRQAMVAAPPILSSRALTASSHGEPDERDRR